MCIINLLANDVIRIARDQMVKTLRDCCLASIARNISTISRLGTFLSVRDKEILLERLCWHGLLTTQSIPYVTYHLFSDTLQRINLSYCNQVDDKLLEVLSQSGCRPQHVTVHDCPNVTSKLTETFVLVMFVHMPPTSVRPSHLLAGV